MGFRDHFSTQARQYAAFRPTYPPALAACLAGLAPGRRLAWDCATGQGQAARLLAAEFDRVVATDASAAQIDSAAPAERVEFRVADAASSGLDATTVDLITVAQAAHWLDLEAFYAEARRVLRPCGVLAIWGYVLLKTGRAPIDDALQTFQDVTMGPYWPAGREILDARYATLPFPFERLVVPDFKMHARWTRDNLIGYVSSWSALARYREQQGSDPLPTLADAIGREWADTETLDIEWPLYLLVGRA
jgi:SAM-dependent methyltransferase